MFSFLLAMICNTTVSASQRKPAATHGVDVDVRAFPVFETEDFETGDSMLFCDLVLFSHIIGSGQTPKTITHPDPERVVRVDTH